MIITNPHYIPAGQCSGEHMTSTTRDASSAK